MFEDPKVSKAPKAPKAHSPITVYQEGRKVIAFDTQTGKTGVARCHPDDKFDFYYGAGLAIERLTGYKSEAKPEPTIIHEPEYYSGKVVCVLIKYDQCSCWIEIIKISVLFAIICGWWGRLKSQPQAACRNPEEGQTVRWIWKTDMSGFP